MALPNLDKTGPLGEGAQTGLKQGNCTENSTDNNFFGHGRFGFGRGRGGRRGRCFRLLGRRGFFGGGWNRRVSKQDLIDYRQELESELEAVKKEEESLD